MTPFAMFFWTNVGLYIALTAWTTWRHYLRTGRSVSFWAFWAIAGSPGWLLWWDPFQGSGPESARRSKEMAVRAFFVSAVIFVAQLAAAALVWALIGPGMRRSPPE